MKLSFLSFLIALLSGVAHADFFRNDFLPVGHVRTDAILNKDCLSDHVHTFYGPPLLYPQVTFDDLRNSDPQKSSGNIEENLSLYWHPSVYHVAADGTKTLQESEFTTVYYNWIPGKTIAFPPGFRMITPGEEVFDEGVVPGQSEYELSISFPSCWKGGNNLDSPDQSHVAFPIGEDEDAPCPSSHPYRIPRLDFFIRFFNTNSAKWEFSDGSTRFHADYISGWDEDFLQSILDGGDGDVDSRVTFRAGLVHQGNDSAYRQQLKEKAVPQADTSCISTETISNVISLPRGSCTGALVSPFGVCGPAPSPVSTTPAPPTPSPSLRATNPPPTSTTTTTASTTTTTNPPPTTTTTTTSSTTTTSTTTTTNPPPTTTTTTTTTSSTDPNEETDLRWVVCGRGVDGPGGLASCAEGDSKMVREDEIHEVRCCREQEESVDGWTRKCASFDSTIYGRSQFMGACHQATFWDAWDICNQADGRLCTKEEVENSCTKGTGCGHDGDLVWTCTEEGRSCTESVSCCSGWCRGNGLCH